MTPAGRMAYVRRMHIGQSMHHCAQAKILRHCFQARWAQDSSRLQSLHLLLIMIYQQGVFLGLQNLLSACHSIDPAVEAARPTAFVLYVPEITSLPILQSQSRSVEGPPRGVLQAPFWAGSQHFTRGCSIGFWRA